MDSRVNAGIGTNRKGFARIDVTDSDGNPIKGLSFKAKQKNHYFNFGCNMFLRDLEYGVANINGFKGDYDLEFSYNGKNYTKSKLDGRYDCINKITLD